MQFVILVTCFKHSLAPKFGRTMKPRLRIRPRSPPPVKTLKEYRDQKHGKKQKRQIAVVCDSSDDSILYVMGSDEEKV